MKSRIKEFDQHLWHDIEDEEKAEEYLDECLPIIGEVIMYFNGLESALNSVLCEWFTDRTDSTGLVVMGSMAYSSKVDLFKRLCDDFHWGMRASTVGYQNIITNLNESSRLRNMVAHANWESMDEEGYTFVKLKISRQGLKQEYIQFTRESLIRIVELIISTRHELYDFWENRNDLLYGRV
ncbi:hypothetical protein [Marinimicrobium agarilyticum]|uniref:hypothetical protein n=1 Tax=Marinimicrobium agarilyticum TaxID=306546 RepID=UPI0004831133|nr:hypothetical protein [Marinimicrobium agarilyticum]